MADLYKQGKVTITHRQGDVYFGSVFMDLPPIPKIYRRFFPEDYEAQIPDEERRKEFLSIGGPRKTDMLRLDKSPGRVAKLLLDNIGVPLRTREIKEKIPQGELGQTLGGLEFKFNKHSRCFNLSKEMRGREALYTLTRTDPSQDYLKRLEELDNELGIDSAPKDSLDSAML